MLSYSPDPQSNGLSITGTHELNSIEFRACRWSSRTSRVAEGGTTVTERVTVLFASAPGAGSGTWLKTSTAADATKLPGKKYVVANVKVRDSCGLRPFTNCR